MTEFAVTERFKIPTKELKKGCKIVDVDQLERFWRGCDHVADKRGCYIFSMKAGKGEKPFYVGKAAKQSFRDECFSPHKRADHYNYVLCSQRGTPYMCFVVQRKVRGKWSMTAIDGVEEFLIAYAAARNSSLTNKRRLPDLGWSIRGVAAAGPGKPSKEAKSFRTLLGIN